LHQRICLAHARFSQYPFFLGKSPDFTDLGCSPRT
jgi:hypothetical protein